MSQPSRMRNLAVVYCGAEKVEIRDIGYPKMIDPQGNPTPHAVIVKSVALIFTSIQEQSGTTAMYRGRTALQPLSISFGHEQTGEVVEVGPHVSKVKVMSICQRQRSTRIVTCAPGDVDILVIDLVIRGGWQGGQAEYNLIPWADYQCLVLPKQLAKDKMLDLCMLSDILPTGFDGAVTAGVGVGKTVYIGGAGPVGICCAASCLLLGAAVRLENVSQLHPNIRTLDLRKIGSQPQDINSALKEVIGHGVVDCTVDCVGFEACGLGSQHDKNVPEAVMNTCFCATKSGGSMGIPGAYLDHDMKPPADWYQHGIYPLQYGLAWVKGLTITGRQCPVMNYHRELMISILHSRVSVAKALNVQVISLQEAPEAYKKFSAGDAVKYVIDPHGMLGRC